MNVGRVSHVLGKRADWERLLVTRETDERQQLPKILDERQAEMFELIICTAVDRNHHKLHGCKQKDDVNDKPRDEAIADRIK